MTKTWEEIFDENEDKIFNALVEAEKQRHDFKNGSGYNVCVYLENDGSTYIDIDTQSSFYPTSDKMICIYCAPTFGECIDPDSYTLADIAFQVNFYCFEDARLVCRQRDQVGKVY